MRIKEKIVDFKIGDKIVIKSFNEINSELDESKATNGVYFNPSMKKLCNDHSVIIHSFLYNKIVVYKISGNSWTWTQKWLKHEE